MHIQSTLFNKIVKPISFVLLLLPLSILVSGFYLESLGANPIEYILRDLGEWALRILLLALLVSPASRALKWAQLLQLRRMIGLFAFFYASLHLLCYLTFEQDFDLKAIVGDIWDRPFITAGFGAFLCLLPLAITSTQKIMRQMGPCWKRLHMLVYPAVILCVIHFWWLVKTDISEPIVYASLTTIILLERAWQWIKKKR